MPFIPSQGEYQNLRPDAFAEAIRGKVDEEGNDSIKNGE